MLHCVWQGMVLVWESYKLDPYVQKLAEAVLNFQEKVKKKTIKIICSLINNLGKVKIEPTSVNVILSVLLLGF